MLKFWRNPLLVLYVRSELRPARAAITAAITLVVCILIGMGCWSADHDHRQAFLPDLYAWLVGIQFVLLGVWSAGTCGQAVARERELKTFDFLKTTRLTAAELMIGKLLGAPIVAYFIVICTLPISILAGLIGGVRPVAVLGSVVLLAFFNFFYSLAALWGSMLVEKASSGAVGLMMLLANLLALAFMDSPFKGITAISVVPALFSLHGLSEFDVGRIAPTVFGKVVPCFTLTLALYVLLGAWFVLMMVRNLKRDLSQIQVLSRWQCVGLMAFWNLLFYAFLDTHAIMDFSRFAPLNHAPEIANFAVAWNAFFLFLIGVAALSPPEKLKIWWRNWKSGSASYLSPNGLPWPWLVPAAVIAYGMMAAEALGLRSSVPISGWRLGFVAVAFLAFLIFTARDVLFLQWCLLTRMKHPVMKGMLFLVFYYSAAGMVGAVAGVFSNEATLKVIAVLTPYAWFIETKSFDATPAIGRPALVLQLAFCILIHVAIQKRLARPVRIAEESAA